MRLSEAFEIGRVVKVRIKQGKEWVWVDRLNSDETESGIHYVIVGHKTPQSKRRVAFPDSVLPFLPSAITGRLFEGNAPPASKRLNGFLRDIGITDTRKVLHSLRHPAKDRLRAARCDHKMQQWLLGHDEKTVSDGYGEGPPVTDLKEWIDKIGF